MPQNSTCQLTRETRSAAQVTAKGVNHDQALPRWSKILQARSDLAAGVYDSGQPLEAMLDTCVQSILTDLGD